MRWIAFSAVTAALLSAAGCAVFSGSREELDSTETFVVTPGNGVWDDEYGRTADPRDCSFTFRVVRYADGFGVKARVRDDRIKTDNCKPGSIAVEDQHGKQVCPSWDDDNLECFFDGDCDRSKDAREGHGLEYGGEYTLVANGAAQSDFSGLPRSFGRDWKGSVKATPCADGGYLLDYDLWFSWRCLGRRSAPQPTDEVTFGFTVCIHDDDDGGRNDKALYWKGNPALPYRDESGFGTITFKGSGK